MKKRIRYLEEQNEEKDQKISQIGLFKNIVFCPLSRTKLPDRNPGPKFFELFTEHLHEIRTEADDGYKGATRHVIDIALTNEENIKKARKSYKKAKNLCE